MRIQSTADVHKTGIKMIVYGESGVGKTTLAGHLTEPTFIISAESGLKSLRDLKIDYVDITLDDNGKLLQPQQRAQRLLDVYQWLLLPEQQAKYKNLFVDSVSEVAQNILAYYEAVEKADIAAGKKIDLRAKWGDYGKKFIEVVRAFRDIPHYNVVFTALEDLDKDELARRFYGPSVPGKIGKEFLVPAFDIVFRLASLADGKRVFQTTATETVRAKARGVKVATSEEANLQRIFNLINEDKSEEKK